VGSVRLRLTGGRGGVAGWSLRDAATADLDGLPTDLVDCEGARSGELFATSPKKSPPRGDHPLGVTAIDHVVVFTPDLRRTTTAFEAAGIELRRLREPAEPGPPLRQAFFRLGEVIVELVEADRGGEGPARFWGITFRVADIDACAALLGERLGEIRGAVQPGRRIATVRRRAGLGLPIALISH
jgi:hypothetical protein